jgi:hypothetical protein
MAIEESLGPLYQAVKRAPVEIRDAGAALMSRGSVATLDQHLASAAGEGAATATVTLPGGRKIVQHISGEFGGAAALADLADRIRKALEQAPEDVGERSVAPLNAGLKPAPGGRATNQGGEDPAFFVRLFRGTWRQASEIASPTTDAGLDVAMAPGRASILNRSPGAITLQVLQPALRPLNIVVPPMCRVSATASPSGLRFAASFGVPLVDELVGMRLCGGLSALSGVAQTLTADDSLDIARDHWSAALTASYIMLRAGDIEEAGRSIAVLASRLPLQPDLLLLQAELHARRGEDDAAEDGFLAAARCGPPLFSTGLTCLVDRLRMYLQSAAPEKAGALKEQLVQLQRLALRCEFKLVFTNYTGVAPAEPDDEVLPQDASVPPSAIVVAAGAQT